MQPRSWHPRIGAVHLAFSPCATWAALLDEAGVVTVLAPDGGHDPVRVEVGPGIAAVAISGDGSTLATVDARRVRVIPTAAPGDARSLLSRCGHLVTTQVQPSPVGERFSVAPHDLLFAPDARALLLSWQTFDDTEMYYGGGWLTSTSQATLVRLPRGAEEELFAEQTISPITYGPRDADADGNHVAAAAFSPDGRCFGLLRRSGRLALRALAGGPFVGPPQAEIRAFAFVPGAAAVMAACGERVVTWDIAGGERGSFAASAELVALACAPDGGRVACLDTAGDVTLLAAATGEPLASLPRAHTSPARALAWVAERVSIVCDDGTLVSWS